MRPDIRVIRISILDNANKVVAQLNLINFLDAIKIGRVLIRGSTNLSLEDSVSFEHVIDMRNADVKDLESFLVRRFFGKCL